VSDTLKGYIKDEAKAVGFKETQMNDKLFEAIARAVDKFLKDNVLANVESGDSAGQWKLVTS
jgi:ABC-type Zn uptake system ZnuABC Zn-binding protein ZnuA